MPNILLFLYEFYPAHTQQLVIIRWMDSCIPKEEEEDVAVSVCKKRGGGTPAG
jgi:hypothetical protein